MPEAQELYAKGMYTKLTEKASYKLLAWIPPAFAALMLAVVLVNGVNLGIDFKGGTWMDLLTAQNLSSEDRTQLEQDFTALGLSDVKVYVGYDIESGKNRVTISSTSVAGKDDVAPILGKYTGLLLETDTAEAVLEEKPSADLADRLSAILKEQVKVSYEGNILTIKALDLEEGPLESALAYSTGDDVQVSIQKKNFNSRSVEPTLGTVLREQGLKAFITAFILMSFVVFIAFREIVPCVAVMQAAICDVAMAVGFISILGISFEPATLAALLMLIGYSVDSDILLTARVLKKRGGDVLEKIDEAMKTGLMMTGTTLVVMVVILIVSVETRISLLQDIASVLLLGLFADLFTTWFTNAGMLRWYLEVPGKRKIFGRKW